MALACFAVPFVIVPLRCAGVTVTLWVAVVAVKNGTATLSYRDEFARILMSAQEPISQRNDILLRYGKMLGHIRHESRSQAARFLFW
jgi:hypothetical protein